MDVRTVPLARLRSMLFTAYCFGASHGRASAVVNNTPSNASAPTSTLAAGNAAHGTEVKAESRAP